MKTAREILDAIDALFVEAEEADLQRELGSADQAPIVQEALKLGRVLTALRGPDDGNDDVKLVTTAPIRAAAFPRTAAWLATQWRHHSLFIGLTKNSSEVIVPVGVIADHFYDHVSMAAAAVGLEIKSNE